MRPFLAVAVLGVIPTSLLGQNPPAVPAVSERPPAAAAPRPDSTQAPGRIAGRVVDAESGRPIVGARISVVGVPGSAETDLDGRYRTGAVPAGLRKVRVAAIGYGAQQRDSVRVASGQAALVSFALQASAVILEELAVTSETPTRASSASGLLAAQQASAVVSDGISAETISKTPDSDAGAAAVRVTGVSILNDKVVVRGLGERYSSSLLNGVEIASPEPDKKFVPLDVFPAALLEALVASKAATPDKPGDFAGGTVDIQTKEFPDNFTLSLGASQGYNTQSTFKMFPSSPRSGWDFLGFNGSHRGFPRPTVDPERFAESLSNVWTPASRRSLPDLGVDFSLGGRQDRGNNVFGYVISGNYSRSRDFIPDKFTFQTNDLLRGEESAYRVDLSGIFNLNFRAGTGHKFGFKNFYSRGSSDEYRQSIGFNAADFGEGVTTLNYQLRFVQRFVAQTQLTGDHYFPGLLNSRFEWKASYGRAGRDDLDNRTLTYTRDETGTHLSLNRPFYRTNTQLADRSWSGQGDWSFPFRLRTRDDAMFKLGGSVRDKSRDYAGTRLRSDVSASLVGSGILDLPPEQLFAPENLGPGGIVYFQESGTVNPYVGGERVYAGYGMLDFELLPRVRLVGGLRYERWSASIDPTVVTSDSVSDVRTRRKEEDYLWSANLTWTVSNNMNVRAAAYRTTVRPDLRELAFGGYAEVLGDCFSYGNPDLVPSAVNNADFRIEVYPGGNQLVAVSAYYKEFKQPIVTAVEYAGQTICRPRNGTRATNYGLEVELRKSLGFLGGFLSPFALATNVTLLRSRIELPESIGIYPDDLRFQGQSPYLLNASLTYSPEKAPLTASVLVNRFGERIVRYGVNTGTFQAPNFVETPRTSLDAKLKLGLWGGFSGSVSGKNLLNSPFEWRDDAINSGATQAALRLRYRAGRSFSVGMSYAP